MTKTPEKEKFRIISKYILHYPVYSSIISTLADMAQLVEQRIRNAQAVGSSPTISSKKTGQSVWAAMFFTCNTSRRPARRKGDLKNVGRLFGERTSSGVKENPRKRVRTIRSL